MKLKYILLGAALALGLVIKRKPGERELRIGAIEDPEAARFYLGVTNLPQFQLIRWLVARRATEGEPRDRALDVGTGPGKLAIQLAHLSPGLEVVGLDPSDEMVKLASENAQREGMAGTVSFRKGSAEEIPFPDASFDLVVSTLSLHHWTDPVAGLREIGRVLKPGGRFLILDLRRDVALLPWSIMWLVQNFVLPSPLRQVGEPIGSVKAAYTPDEVAQLAWKAGLNDWHVATGPAWLILESTA